MWKKYPQLLGSDPKAIKVNARTMRLYGIETTKSLANLMLLATKVKLKRQKIAFIRKEILGHKIITQTLQERKKINSQAKSSRRKRKKEFAQI